MPDESVVLEITADRVHVEWQGMSLTLVADEATELKVAMAESIFRLAADLPNRRRCRDFEKAALSEASYTNKANALSQVGGLPGGLSGAIGNQFSSLNRY